MSLNSEWSEPGRLRCPCCRVLYFASPGSGYRELDREQREIGFAQGKAKSDVRFNCLIRKQIAVLAPEKRQALLNSTTW